MLRLAPLCCHNADESSGRYDDRCDCHNDEGELPRHTAPKIGLNPVAAAFPSRSASLKTAAPAKFECKQQLLLRGTGGRWDADTVHRVTVNEVKEDDDTVKVRYSDGGYKRFQKTDLADLIVGQMPPNLVGIDYICVGVVIDVPIEIDSSWSNDQATAGDYTISGPQKVLTKLSKYSATHGDEWNSPRGQLSPLAAVTVPEEFRAAAGIPIDADHFCYIYPIYGFAARLLSGNYNLARNSWARVLVLGGFAYFSSAKKLLRINAVTLGHQDAGLLLLAHPVTDMDAVCKLQRDKRLAETHSTLRNWGFTHEAWIHPGESIGGRQLSSNTAHTYDHGAFLYQLDDGRAVFYALQPSEDNEFKQAAAALDVLAASEEKYCLAVSQDGMRQSCIKADQIQKAAGQYALVPEAWPEVRGEETDWEKELTKNGIRILIVVLFLGLGILFYTQTEDWTAIEALYFSVVTISTVGYGDYAPEGNWQRLFTVFYMLLGIFMVFEISSKIYESTFRIPEQWIRDLGSWFMQFCFHQKPYRHFKRNGELMPAWRFYASGLLPQLVCGMSLNIFLSALIFTETQDDGTKIYADLLWHCWITAGTVGYGDISLDNDDSRLFSSFHILVSVSWLTKMIRSCDALQKQRKFDLRAFEAINTQLDDRMLENFDRSGEGQICKTEFIVGMLLTMGARIGSQKMTYEDHIKPHLDRFDTLDFDKNAFLGRKDIQFMVEETQRSKKADKLAAIANSKPDPNGRVAPLHADLQRTHSIGAWT